ncbi:MAG: hypothetical protein KJO54_02480 [Gammaproteobacteria bacterium]|nr:hypothetical protein [Gammaproteobacteria bacterium]
MHKWVAIGLLALPGLSLSAELTTPAAASTMVLAQPEPAGKKIEPGKIRRAFSNGNFWQRLRKQRAMPVLQLIQSHKHELFIGVEADGTVGFRYSFGR